MGASVQPIVDQVVALLSWPDEIWTLVVDLATKVGHVEDAQVHGLVHRGRAIATPVGARKDGGGAVGQASAPVGTRKGKIHVDSGRGHLVTKATRPMRSAAWVHVYRVVPVERGLGLRTGPRVLELVERRRSNCLFIEYVVMIKFR